jgi:hypothetical protein
VRPASQEAGRLADDPNVSGGGPAISAHARRCCCPRRRASVGPIGSTYTEPEDASDVGDREGELVAALTVLGVGAHSTTGRRPQYARRRTRTHEGPCWRCRRGRERRGSGRDSVRLGGPVEVALRPSSTASTSRGGCCDASPMKKAKEAFAVAQPLVGRRSTVLIHRLRAVGTAYATPRAPSPCPSAAASGRPIARPTPAYSLAVSGRVTTTAWWISRVSCAMARVSSVLVSSSCSSTRKSWSAFCCWKVAWRF